MISVPQRVSLVVQVANSIRRALNDQEWTNHLPSEQFLARQLQVSNITVRRALKILAKEGLVTVSKGRRAQITKNHKPVRRGSKARVVGVIAPPGTIGPMRPGSVYYEAYRAHMHDAGLQSNFYSDSRFYSKNPAKLLDALIHDTNVDLWLLTMSTLEMQRWFMRQKLPTIVDGTRRPEVNFPSIDFDYRSMCRHAVGKFLQLGHKHIAMLAPGSGSGGELASIQGFNEGISQSVVQGRRGSIICCETSAESCCSALAEIFRDKQPPTAILTLKPQLTFTALTHLLTKGIRVPEDVSVISRDNSPNLAYLVPSVAAYQTNSEAYAHRLVRMIQKFFEGTLSSEQQFIIPAFQNGKSLGPCPRL